MLQSNFLLSMTKKKLQKRVIGLFAFIILFFSCSHNFKKNDKFIKSYECLSVFQFVIEDDNQVVSLNGEFVVTHCNGWKIYQALRPQYVFKSVINEKSGAITDELLSVVKKYMIYILKDGDSTGYELDSTYNKVSNTLRLASFKKRREILNFSNFYNAKTDSLIAVKKSKDTLLETYIPRFKIDRSYPIPFIILFGIEKKMKQIFHFLRNWKRNTINGYTGWK